MGGRGKQIPPDAAVRLWTVLYSPLLLLSSLHFLHTLLSSTMVSVTRSEQTLQEMHRNLNGLELLFILSHYHHIFLFPSYICGKPEEDTKKQKKREGRVALRPLQNQKATEKCNSAETSIQMRMVHQMFLCIGGTSSSLKLLWVMLLCFQQNSLYSKIPFYSQMMS